MMDFKNEEVGPKHGKEPADEEPFKRNLQKRRNL